MTKPFCTVFEASGGLWEGCVVRKGSYNSFRSRWGSHRMTAWVSAEGQLATPNETTELDREVLNTPEIDKDLAKELWGWNTNSKR